MTTRRVFGVSPLVGRGPDLAAVGAVLDTPDARGALILGPVGVGKTRLATEIMGRRAAAGWAVPRVIATAATADIPLGALAPITRPAAARSAGRSARRRDALVEAVVDQLVESAEGAPLLLVVDDVHHLDAASHAVIRLLVERRLGRVLGTARTPLEPLPSPWSAPGLVNVVLNDLDADAVAEVLVSTLGGPVAGDLTRHLAVSTEGNPLLLREVLAAAFDEGSLRCIDGIWTLDAAATPTRRLADLVGGRLAQLDRDRRDALEMIAVAEVVPVELAAQVVGHGVLADLERTGLIRRESLLDHAVVRPSHPFYGEALRAGLGPIARRHHARRLADAAQRAGDDGVDVLRVVAWRTAAGGQVEPDLLTRAAREARRRSEFGRAADLAARAVEAGGGLTSLLLLGELQNAVGDFVEADATFGQALEPVLSSRGPAHLGRTASASDANLVGLTALAMAFNRAWGLGGHVEARALLLSVVDAFDRNAETGVDPRLVERRSELLADAAALAAFSGQWSVAVAESLTVADTSASPRVVARRAFAYSSGLIGVGRPEAASAVADAGLAALDEQPDGFGRVTFGTNLLLSRTIAAAEAGELSLAEASAAATYQQAVDIGLLTGQAVAAWARGRVLLQQGRAVSAERWLREARLLEHDLRTRGRRRWCLIELGLALVAQGRTEEAQETLDELDDLDQREPTDDAFSAAREHLLRASLHQARGEVGEAEVLLVGAAERSEVTGAAGDASELWHAVILTGSSPRAVDGAAAALLGLDGRLDGSLHRARVIDARGVAQRDLPTRLAAAEAFSVTGARGVAWAVLQAVALAASLDGSRGLARTANERAEVLAGMVEGVGWRPPGDALAGLGPRQREVALLVAAGHSNQEVADRLGLSPRTVENHLHRAYRELGIEGRRELTDLTGLGSN